MHCDLRHWATLLFLELFAKQAAGICEGQRYLRTDGYTFKFTVEVMFHSDSVDNTDQLTILNSSTDAFRLYRAVDTRVYFVVVKKDKSNEATLVSNAVTSLATWHTLIVEKTITHACLKIDSYATKCLLANWWDIGDPGEVTALNQKGVEVRHYLQAPVEHAQKFSFNASSGKLFQYFLVAIQDQRQNAARDDYADVSDPTLGLYTKPKFGSFTRLQFDCGYQFGGVLGSIEIEGNWTWEPTPNSANKALLVTNGSATLVEKVNVTHDPYLPGYPGVGRSTHPWNNYHTNFYPTFGSGGFSDLDGEASMVGTIFACHPSSATDFNNWITWADSPNGTQDTNKFIRVWLGQEVGGGPDTTATTTGTCTTTTTTTMSTSSRTSSTGTGQEWTSTTSSTTSTGSSSTTSSRTVTVTATASRTTSSTSTSRTTTSSSFTSSSTSISTSSSASSTTRSSTLSTTTTTSTTSTTLDVSALLAWVSSQESALVDAIVSDPNATSMSKKLSGLMMEGFLIHNNEDTTLDLDLDLEGPQASLTLTVPGSVLRTLSMGSAVVVVSVLDAELAASVGPLDAALNVNLFDLSGARARVRGLLEPMQFTMPVNRSKESSCGYWDVEHQEWSQTGMREVPGAGQEGELLVCSATHLTLFGAILKGFFKVFTCAQVSLLSMDAVKKLFVGNWWNQPMALLFWLLELVFGLMLAAACLLDLKRQKNGTWDNEFFLIPSDTGKAAPETPEVKDQQVEEPEMEGEKTVCLRLQAAVACVLLPCTWFCQSSACRDVLDAVCSRWFKNFSDIRSFCESVFENIQCSPSCGLKTIWASLAGSLVRSSAQRQVSVSLGLSQDIVSCFLEDELMAELLCEAAVISEKIQATGPTNKWEQRLLACHRMHQRILEEFDEYWHRTSWSSFPMACMRLLFMANPFSPLFLRCYFMTSAQRVLFLVVDMNGALMLMTLFFQFSGTTAADVDPKCLEGSANLWEELGRLAAIALASIVVSNIPVMVLGTLHNRSFRRFDYAGCPGWERQLVVWKVQDVLVWVIGLGYICLCGIFVTLFLANVAQPALWEWGATEGMALAEDCVFIPLGLSLVIPLLAGIALSLASLTAGAQSGEVLKNQRAELEDSGGNWRPFIQSI